MCARACAACVVAYLVSFFLVSRIEMCVSGVRNEPQKEGGRREGRRRSRRLLLLTEQPYRSVGRRRKEKGACARSLSLSLSGALLVVRPSDVRPLPGALSLLGLSLSLSVSLCVRNNFFRECRRPSSLSLSLPSSLSPSLSGAGFIISTINAFGSRRDTGRMIKRFPASGAVTRPPASPPAHLYCLPTYIRPDLASVSAAAPKV